jgi:hypothetical protein
MAIMDQALKNDAAPRHERVRNGLWIVLVASFTVLASLVLACAAPLSGVATFAVAKMRPTAGCIAVGLAWLANQLVGYVVLDYPQTWDNLGWGAAMGIATALAFLGATAVSRTGMRDSSMTAIGFAASFLIYEASLFAATAVLPSWDRAFSLRVLAWIFLINAVALMRLLVLHSCALALRLFKPLQPPI